MANEVVYVGSDDHNVYALNAKTGALLWSQPFSIRTSSPAVANGVVYIGGSSVDDMYALNASTGAQLWSYKVSSYMNSSPTVVNGMVYASTNYPARLYAFIVK